MPEATRRGDRPILFGVDVGGTHTDLCIADVDGISRVKALTTHDDYSRGILDAIVLAAEQRGVRVHDLLARVGAVSIGTTIVTNSVTELRGARVGIITTRGFRDTFRLLGGARKNVYDDQLQTNPPDITARASILEVDERISRDGEALVALDEDGVRAVVRELKEGGAETIAVCFLWSFMNDTHETRVAEIAREEWPGVFVTTSSSIHPVIREYERFSTAVLNSFCQPPVERLLSTLELALRDAGFDGRLSLVSGAGGAIGKETALRFPIVLLGSGPAAGVTAAAALATAVGESDVIVGDMGGTSFDTCVVRDGVPSVASRITVGGFETGLRLVEVISIGAGGGSIASLDERGVPQVGPWSAGSEPGPACYDRGGELPTVTDAAVSLGLIDPSGYLDGRVSLDREKARIALEKTFAPSDAWSMEDAARGVIELTATNMAHALRSVTVERGHDPREFLMVAYGGMLPLFVTSICDKLGVEHAVVPQNSAAFSAMGTLLSDYVRRYSMTVGWDMREGSGFEPVQQRRDELRALALEDAGVEGLDHDDIRLDWGAECRFTGQVYEVEMPLDAASFDAVSAEELSRRFREHYEVLYGKGTAWPEASVTLLNLTLTVCGAREKPALPESNETDREAVAVGRRQVWLGPDSAPVKVPIHRDEDLHPGAVVAGPAIIDQHDSTLLVGREWSARRDRWFNFVLSREAADRATNGGVADE